MSQPAVCEIHNCGVQAIGRCHQCSKAFCLTHQGYSAPAFYNNVCIACIESQRVSKILDMQAYEREKENAIKRLHEILDKLIEAGNIGQITQYRRKEKKRLWWYIEEQVEWCRAWPIGNLNWQHIDAYNERSIVSSPTGITSDKQLRSISIPDDYPHVEKKETFISISAPTGSYLDGSDLGIERLTLAWALQAIKHLEEIAKRHYIKVAV